MSKLLKERWSRLAFGKVIAEAAMDKDTLWQNDAKDYIEAVWNVDQSWGQEAAMGQSAIDEIKGLPEWSGKIDLLDELAQLCLEQKLSQGSRTRGSDEDLQPQIEILCDKLGLDPNDLHH